MPAHRNLRDKEKIQDWAKSLFRLPNFYIIDTETTGVGKSDEAIQIGIIDKHGKTVIDTLVKPTRPVSAGASAVNGISNSMLADAPTFDELYVKLSSVLAASVLVAYNMEFDWRILQQTSAKYGLPLFNVKTKHCAMIQYAQYYGMWSISKQQYSWQKLSNACTQQKIAVVDAHSALGDVRMTLALMEKMTY
jgi:DNA polymerase III subunit epsilon